MCKDIQLKVDDVKCCFTSQAFGACIRLCLRGDVNVWQGERAREWEWDKSSLCILILSHVHLTLKSPVALSRDAAGFKCLWSAAPNRAWLLNPFVSECYAHEIRFEHEMRCHKDCVSTSHNFWSLLQWNRRRLSLTLSAMFQIYFDILLSFALFSSALRFPLCECLENSFKFVFIWNGIFFCRREIVGSRCVLQIHNFIQFYRNQ